MSDYHQPADSGHFGREGGSFVCVTLTFAMPVRRIQANPAVKDDIGRLAVERGPLVFCAEAQDQEAPLALLRLPPEAPLQARFRPDLLGGTVVIEAEAEALSAQSLYATTPPQATPSPLVALPYWLWCNRGPNAMQVWIRSA